MESLSPYLALKAWKLKIFVGFRKLFELHLALMYI
jgi:hypothetical protein